MALWQINWSCVDAPEGVALEIEPTTLVIDDEGTARAINGLDLRCLVSGVRCVELSGEVVAQPSDRGLSLRLDRLCVDSPSPDAQLPSSVALRPHDRIEVDARAGHVGLGHLDARTAKASPSTRIEWQLGLDLPAWALGLLGKASSRKADDQPLSVRLTGEVRRLELASSLIVPRACRVNNTGNFTPPLSVDPEDGWLTSADGSVLQAPAAVTLKVQPGARAAFVRDGRELARAIASDESGEVALPVGALTAGRHAHVVYLWGPASGEGPPREKIALKVEAEHSAFVSLPMSRRFLKGVDLADGHLTLSFTDFKLQGAGLPLEFIRTYSNLSALGETVLPLGAGWTHNYLGWVRKRGAKYQVLGGEGNGQTYALGASGGTGGYNGTLTGTDASGFVLTTLSGTLYTYKTPWPGNAGTWLLSEIADANGYGLRIDYRPDGLVSTVTETRSQRTLSFSYELRPVGSRKQWLISQVSVPFRDQTQPVGILYGHDELGNLETVKVAGVQPDVVHRYDYTKTLPSPHRLRTYIDPDGRKTEYKYREAAAVAELERVEKVADADGTTTFLHHLETVNNNGEQVQTPVETTVTPPVATLVTKYKFKPRSSGGMVTDVVHPDGHTSKWIWVDQDRWMREEFDASGRHAVYLTDGAGNIDEETVDLAGIDTSRYDKVTARDGGGVVEGLRTKYQYGPGSRRIRRITKWEKVAGKERPLLGVEFDLDDRGNLLGRRELEAAEALAQNPTAPWTVRYEHQGMPRQLRVERRLDVGETVYDNYNALGQPRLVVQSVATGEARARVQEFDGRGRLVDLVEKHRDRVIAHVRYKYDALDRVTDERREWPGLPGLAADLAPPARVTKRTFHPGGALQTEEISGDDGKVLFKVEMTYDRAGRPATKKQHPFGPGAGQPVIAESWTYDAMGRMDVATNGRGVQRKHHYDSRGRLGRVDTLAPQPGTEMAQTYEPGTDTLATITDAYGFTTTLRHDALDNLSRRTLPIAGPHNFEALSYDSLGLLKSKSDLNGHTTTFEYSAHGVLLAETGPRKHKTTYVHDRARRLRARTDGLTQLTTATQYDGLGRVTQTTESGLGVSHVTTYAFDDARGKVTIKRATGAVIEEWRDGRDLVLKRVTDPAGAAMTELFTYDPMGHLVTSSRVLGSLAVVTRHRVDALGRSWGHVRRLETGIEDKEERTLDEAGNVRRLVDAAGYQWDREYDHRDRLKRETVSGGQLQGTVELRKLVYEDLRHIRRETDAGGGTLTTARDALGRVVSVEHSELPGRKKVIVFDGENLASESDWRGNATAYSYDELHRRKTATDPLQHVTTTAYTDSLPRKTSVVDRSGIETVAILDARGRQTEQRIATIVQWVRAYDADDRVVHERDAAGIERGWVYDARGRLIEHRVPGRVRKIVYDQTGVGAREWLAFTPGGAPDFVRAFDSRGLVLSEKDGRGIARGFKYDAKGRVIEQDDGAGLLTSFTYDHLGTVTSETRAPKGLPALAVTYRFRRDPLGRLTELEDPAGYRTGFAYDRLGRLRSKSLYSRGGQQLVTRWTQDDDGRPATCTYPDGTQLEWKYDSVGWLLSATVLQAPSPALPYARQTSYERDREGRPRVVRQRVVDSAGERDEAHAIAYDPLGRPVSETWPMGGKVTRRLDALGRVEEIRIDGEPEATRYAYDGRGLLESVEGPLGKVAYQYDMVERLSTVTYPDGWESNLERESNGWLKLVAHKHSAGEELAFDYSLLPSGDARGVTIKTHAGEERRDFKQDAFHRLDNEQYQTPKLELRHGYDGSGRRHWSSIDGKDHEYTFDDFGRLEALRDKASGTVTDRLWYTSRGQVERRWSRGRQIQVRYNPLGQVVELVWGAAATPGGTMSGAARVTFHYDSEGRRVRRQGPAPGQDEAYLYAGVERLAELDRASGRVRTRYERGLGLIGVLVGQAGASRARWLALRDRLGSVERFVQLGGPGRAGQQYGAYGTILAREGQPPCAAGYGRGYTEVAQLHQAGDLVHLGNRLYDVALGRFWQPDPAHAGGYEGPGEELYGYAEARPTLFVDPTGWFPSSGGFGELREYEAHAPTALSSLDNPAEALLRGIGTVAAGVLTAGSQLLHEAGEYLGNALGLTNSGKDGVGASPGRARDTGESLRVRHMRRQDDEAWAESEREPPSREVTVTESRGQNAGAAAPEPSFFSRVLGWMGSHTAAEWAERLEAPTRQAESDLIRYAAERGDWPKLRFAVGFGGSFMLGALRTFSAHQLLRMGSSAGEGSVDMERGLSNSANDSMTTRTVNVVVGAGKVAIDLLSIAHTYRIASTRLIRVGPEFQPPAWKGYPDEVPRPDGPVRLIDGPGYQISRYAANMVNKIYARVWGVARTGQDIHEIQPVKFYGDPIDINNKVPLLKDVHIQVTTFWKGVQRWAELNGLGPPPPTPALPPVHGILNQDR